MIEFYLEKEDFQTHQDFIYGKIVKQLEPTYIYYAYKNGALLGTFLSNKDAYSVSQVIEQVCTNKAELAQNAIDIAKSCDVAYEQYVSYLLGMFQSQLGDKVNRRMIEKVTNHKHLDDSEFIDYLIYGVFLLADYNA